MGLAVAWSAHMAPHLGQPVKGTAFRAGDQVSRGEWVVSARGMEGGGVYAISRAVRDGAGLTLDLFPDLTADALRARAARLPARDSQGNRLRKLGLAPVAVALAQEWARPLPADVAGLKAIAVPHAGPRPMDEAISTAGGLRFDALEGFMLRDRPGTFAAGEMLDWEAPTGGYLITACLATGRAAGRQAAAWAQRDD
jgi:predicted flavoprotein YhiN